MKRTIACRPLSDAEQKVWELSNRINERGFHVDRKFAEAARKIAQAAGPEIDAELAELTDGAVKTINQIAEDEGLAEGARMRDGEPRQRHHREAAGGG